MLDGDFVPLRINTLASKIRLATFSHSVTVLWNKLPTFTKEIDGVVKFKSAVKMWRRNRSD